MNKIIVLIFAVALVSCIRVKEVKSPEKLASEVTVLLEAGDTLQSIKMLEEFSNDNPDNKNVQGYAIFLKNRVGQISTEEGYKQTKLLFGNDSTNDMIKYYRLLKINQEGNLDEALVELDKRIKEDSTNFNNYLYKGQNLLKLKRYDEAIVAFTKAIELEPENRYAYADRGMAKYLKGDKEGACEEWKTPGGGSILYREKYCK